MLYKLVIAAIALLIGVELAAADEFDGVITDASRAFTMRKNLPEAFVFGKLTLDSQGKVISTVYTDCVVTKATKVAMGKFDEKKKKWTAGEAIDGGIAADLFVNKGEDLQVRVTVVADNKTITQILVKDTDEPLVQADAEFDAILKQIGAQTNGNGGIWYTRLELNDKGGIVQKFALRSGRVTKDTKVVMGKYNAKEKKWEVGDEVPNGLYGDIFKDLGAKTVYVRMTFRDDRKAFAQIMVCQVGEKR